MANEIRIDLADPVLAEALAGCEPGETHTITMDIAVSEKTAELLGTVIPESVEKYLEEEEEEPVQPPELPGSAPVAPVAAAPVAPAAVKAVM
jgi:hypothetical protein